MALGLPQFLAELANDAKFQLGVFRKVAAQRGHWQTMRRDRVLALENFGRASPRDPYLPHDLSFPSGCRFQPQRPNTPTTAGEHSVKHIFLPDFGWLNSRCAAPKGCR